MQIISIVALFLLLASSDPLRAQGDSPSPQDGMCILAADQLCNALAYCSPRAIKRIIAQLKMSIGSATRGRMDPQVFENHKAEWQDATGVFVTKLGTDFVKWHKSLKNTREELDALLNKRYLLFGEGKKVASLEQKRKELIETLRGDAEEFEKGNDNRNFSVDSAELIVAITLSQIPELRAGGPLTPMETYLEFIKKFNELRTDAQLPPFYRDIFKAISNEESSILFFLAISSQKHSEFFGSMFEELILRMDSERGDQLLESVLLTAEGTSELVDKRGHLRANQVAKREKSFAKQVKGFMREFNTTHWFVQHGVNLVKLAVEHGKGALELAVMAGII